MRQNEFLTKFAIMSLPIRFCRHSPRRYYALVLLRLKDVVLRERQNNPS